MARSRTATASPGLARSIAAIALGSLLLACISAEERLATSRDALRDAKSERNGLIEALYREYGGSELAGSLKESIRSSGDDGSAENPYAEIFEGLVTEGDLAAFESQLRTVGRGERIAAVSAKARAFFAQPGVEERCRAVIDLDRTVERLEREVAALEAEVSSG